MEKVIFGWAGSRYLQGLWLNRRLTSADYNRAWSMQAGQCEKCKKDLAHPFRREMRQAYKPFIYQATQYSKKLKLFCQECRPRKGNTHGEV